jgi:exodeoxyribonuclease V alpha subunit
MSHDARLAALRTAGALTALDVGFARTLDRIMGMTGGEKWEVALAAALASRAVGEGNVCADLRALAGNPVRATEGLIQEALEQCPRFEKWSAALRASRLVGDGEGETPLVLDTAGRLYLRRYWEHEQRLVRAIRERCLEDPVLPDAELGERIDSLLPRSAAGGEVDWQRVAAMVVARRRFCVISGGPGTGKTTTVVKILAILAEGLARKLGRRPRIAVLAPTGKAAARLYESIMRQRAALKVDETVRAAIPESAQTIHRALGAWGDGSGRFRYDAVNRHPADVIVVDEASMVPLALMARLVEAMRPSARLVLLGDKDQLSSVEAGSVLGDVCNQGRALVRSRKLVAAAQTIAGERIAGADDAARSVLEIADSIVQLEKSHRFDPRSGIGALAAAINAGKGEKALALLRAGGDVRLVAPPPSGFLHKQVRELVQSRWKTYLTANGDAEKLAAFGELRVLCALRVGPEGTEAANAEIERHLENARLLAPKAGQYHGRPILVTKNDYEVGLFNGDVGVVVEHEVAGKRRSAAIFLGAKNEPRPVSTSLLPPHETAFAMTVHKSQGSEFGAVAVILPQQESPVVTRELLYTAVTRATTSVLIQATEQTIARAIGTPTRRSSGLRDALWGSTSNALKPAVLPGEQGRLL